MATKPPVKYENNPFMIGIEGLKLIFTNAKSTGIYTVILFAAAFIVTFLAYLVGVIADTIANGGSSSMSYSYEAQLSGAELTAIAIWIGVGTLAYIAVSVLLFGPLEYAAAKTAQGQQVSLKDGFRATIQNYPAYLWMYILFTVKVFLWSLLFIVPGFIMFNRYLLAGTVFFAEGKRGNAAIKRSVELTKGAWLTTYGGAWIWGIISQGLTTFVFWPGQMAVLYRQYKHITDTNEQKPNAHVLSWLTLLVPIALFVLYVLFIGGIVLLILLGGSTAP